MSDESGDGFSVGETAQPVIWCTQGRAHVAAEEGMAALIRAGRDIYSRGAQLVYPALVPARNADGKRSHAPGLLTMTQTLMQRELGRVATWKYLTAELQQERNCDPPGLVARQILAMVRDWRFDALAGVTSTPFLTADGALVAHAGFDAASGFYLTDPPVMPEIPARPTQDDAVRALAVLDALLDEFPFVGGVDRAVALSLLLTVTLRPTIGGPVPMHTITAPEPGTGKSYLLDVAAMLATGKLCPVIAATKDPEEVDKKLAAALLAGMAIISIDNANRTLRSDLLAQAIERPLVTIRPLGTSSNVEIPSTATLASTGNNLRVADDLVRRTLRGELDANSETPEARTFARRPVEMIAADRGRYVAAVLTIARAYMVAGRPDRPSPLPSFERWSDLVRGMLIWLGRADPVASIATSRADDPGRQAFATLLDAWPDGEHTAAELVALAGETDPNNGALVRPALREAVAEIASDGAHGAKLSVAKLGYWLRARKGQVACGRKLAQSGPAKARKWFVEASHRGSDTAIGPASDAQKRAGIGSDGSDRAIVSAKTRENLDRFTMGLTETIVLSRPSLPARPNGHDPDSMPPTHWADPDADPGAHFTLCRECGSVAWEQASGPYASTGRVEWRCTVCHPDRQPAGAPPEASGEQGQHPDAPRSGDRCGACRGGRWWSPGERQGWQCAACHPPQSALGTRWVST